MTRVVKLGGSLITFPGLVPAFRDWHLSQPTRTTILVTGGGPFVDLVREIDQHHQIHPDEAHWLCVRLLDATARLLHLLLPETEFCDRYDLLARRIIECSSPLIAFSVEEFLQRHHPMVGGRPIPENWSVTSDSIAAVLATVLSADELVLLKSAGMSDDETVGDLAARGYVDEFLPLALTPRIKLRCVNLRSGQEWNVPRERGHR